MSQRAGSRPREETGVPESALDEFRQSPEFRGSVEPGRRTHEHAVDHFALVYESEAELFTGVAPFVRHGLERGEQCVYILDERSEATIVSALRTRGIDVDEAIESGALTFYTVQETYLRDESFDPDEILSFYGDILEAVLEEYAGLRLIAGGNWVDGVPVDAVLEYEGRANTHFGTENVSALCHYDRTRHSPEVVRNVVETHPHLIVDGTVCHNVYYTPPDELLGTDQAGNEVDRLLGTVRDRARAKTDLAEHNRFLQKLYEITADPERSFEEKVQSLLELGCEQFGLDLGGLNEIDPDTDRFRVEYLSGDHELFEPDLELPLSETYCQAAAGMKQAATVSDPVEAGLDDVLVYEDYGVKTYLGTHIPIQEGTDRTLGFIADDRPDRTFSTHDRTYVELMGQWIQYELEQRQYQTDLEETVEQLQQSNDRLKQFAYAASHDLQEPLRMVSTYLRHLENQYADDLDDEAREYVDFAVDGADRMREMVDDLLAYSRVEQTDGEFQPVSCDAILEAVLEDLQIRIEESDTEIVVESLPTVVANGEQVEQVFQNLLSNAIKYSGDESPRVEVTAEQRGEWWEFSVDDDGIGIDPEKTDRIFEVFKRLHHDDEYSGTGIGLALCQEIVENHGGDIWVEATPGEGSTFYFTLPADGE